MKSAMDKVDLSKDGVLNRSDYGELIDKDNIFYGKDFVFLDENREIRKELLKWLQELDEKVSGHENGFVPQSEEDINSKLVVKDSNGSKVDVISLIAEEGEHFGKARINKGLLLRVRKNKDVDDLVGSEPTYKDLENYLLDLGEAVDLYSNDISIYTNSRPNQPVALGVKDENGDKKPYLIARKGTVGVNQPFYFEDQQGNQKGDSLQDRFASIDKSLRGLNKRLDETNSKIDNVERSLKALMDSNNESMNNRIDELENNLNGKINNLKEKVAADLEAAKGSLKGEISDKIERVGLETDEKIKLIKRGLNTKINGVSEAVETLRNDAFSSIDGVSNALREYVSKNDSVVESVKDGIENVFGLTVIAAEKFTRHENEYHQFRSDLNLQLKKIPDYIKDNYKVTIYRYYPSVSGNWQSDRNMKGEIRKKR